MTKFDEQFREEVERSIQDNENEMENDMSEKSKEELRICDEVLNYEISMGEVEAALQLLKSNKSPGPNEVFTVTEKCWRGAKNGYM